VSMRRLSPVAKSAARTAWGHRLGSPQPGVCAPTRGGATRLRRTGGGNSPRHSFRRRRAPLPTPHLSLASHGCHVPLAAPLLSRRGGSARSLARSLAFHTCRVPLPTPRLSPTFHTCRAPLPTPHLSPFHMCRVPLRAPHFSPATVGRLVDAARPTPSATSTQRAPTAPTPTFYDGDAWFVRHDRLFMVVDLAAA